MTRKLTLVPFVVCTLTAGGCVQATRDFAFTRPWGDYKRIAIHTANGQVRLTCGHGAELRVAGRTRERGAHADRAPIQVVAAPDEQHPDILRVAVHVPDERKPDWLGTDLVIGVPTACDTEIETSNGSIYVADAKSCVLQTSNAQVDVERIEGAVEARTSNGRIKALCVAGDLTARTSNGALQVDRVQESCRLTTSNGEIKVLAAAGDVDATTSNGSIRYEAAALQSRVELRTSNGSISLLLPKQLAGELHLTTSNAPIHARLTGMSADIQHQSPGELRARLNAGGPARVTAQTANGPIRVDFR